MTARAMTQVSQIDTSDVDRLDESLWLDLECPSEAERQHGHEPYPTRGQSRYQGLQRYCDSVLAANNDR